MTPLLSIVVPAYNEAPRLGNTLLKIFRYLNDNNIDSEVIVVDDGSTDETVDVAKQNFLCAGKVKTTLIRGSSNRGKGHAVRTGLLRSSGSIAIFSDADLSTPIEEIPKLLELVNGHSVDIAFGSRAIDRSLIRVHQPWGREFGGRIFNAIVRLTTQLPFTDTQCGFKAFRLDVCKPIIEAATIDRFGFDVELLYVAHLAGLKLQEVGVIWEHSEGSKISFARDSVRMFSEVARIRRQALNGTYKKAIQEIKNKSSLRQFRQFHEVEQVGLI